MTEVRWYADDVMGIVDNANDEMLLALAYQVEAEAKVRAAVDTGFMRNTTYVNGAGTNTFAAKTQTNDNRDYHTVSSAQAAPEREVVVGVAADYAVYSEMEQPFLYPALVVVMNNAGGIIETVGKKHFD